MKIVGLTGGIGSGKTTVANMFMDLGVPVYFADLEAKRLMNTSRKIQKKLIALFGAEAYFNGVINRDYISSRIFNDKNLLEKMNEIVHPEVHKDFNQWAEKQTADYVIKEAAIIFEHQKQSEYDFIIVVVAPVDKRIARLVDRDNTTKVKIIKIIDNQLSDEEKIALSDIVIYNDDLKKVKDQVLKTHKILLQNHDNS